MVRRLALLIPIALLVAGCSPSQADVEKSIRDEMKTQLSVDITSCNLQKQADGTFTGTATASNGDMYDVTTDKPSFDKIQWKAIPGQTMVERVVRQQMEQKTGSQVTSLHLTKNGPGNFSGPAELSSGAKVTVTTHMEGTQLMMNWQ